jgi:ABC-type transporter Mla MlaB component
MAKAKPSKKVLPRRKVKRTPEARVTERLGARAGAGPASTFDPNAADSGIADPADGLGASTVVSDDTMAAAPLGASADPSFGARAASSFGASADSTPGAKSATAGANAADLAGAKTTLRLGASLQIQDIEEACRRLREMLTGAAASAVDVSRVVVTDTAGVQLLLALQQEGARRGAPIEFRGESVAFGKILAILGLQNMFPYMKAHA